MRLLIDGYNLMYAGGLLGKPLRPDGFRKVRTRFLNDLADALGPVDAHATTVVFDASAAPGGVPSASTHKGLSVVYAVDEASADDRIERLIAGHPRPQALTVVSSDRRVRQAASRRKARSLSADEFWVELDARKARKGRATPLRPPPSERPRASELSPEEAAYWLQEFGDLDQRPETREALGNDLPMLTDEEIARIEREVERETE
jgi:hypothetical protein